MLETVINFLGHPFIWLGLVGVIIYLLIKKCSYCKEILKRLREIEGKVDVLRDRFEIIEKITRKRTNYRKS